MMHYITTLKQLKEFKPPRIIELDCETTGLDFLRDNLLMVQVGWRGHQLLLDVRKFDATSWLAPLLSSRSYIKLIQNALFDGCFIEYHLGIPIRNIRDTRLQENILLGRSRNVSASLGVTLDRYNIVKLDKTGVKEFIRMDYSQEFSEAQLQYAANDVMFLTRLDQVQRYKATPTDLKFMDLENACVEETIRMRLNGIGFDEVKWRKIAAKNEKAYNLAEARLPKGVLWTSNQQVKKYFSGMGIHIESYKDLPKIIDPRLNDFKKLRSLYQDVKLFGENWLTQEINKGEITTTVYNGRVHADFNQILETGRYSCRKPNLQQLRAEGEHRECFIAKPGHQFILADYSGQELAIAAVASGEQRWLKAIRNKEDIHGLTAQSIYGSNYTDHHRRLAKRINFAVLYGSGAETISLSTGISIQEAKSAISRWRQAVPTLYAWLREQVAKAERTKASYSLYGRRRDLQDEPRVYTIAQNNPIQATGADLIKLSMVKLHSPYLVLTVHDEIILEAPDKEVHSVTQALIKAMRQAVVEILGEDLIDVTPQITPFWPSKK